MDLPARCALLVFALLNHLDRFFGLQRTPQLQRVAVEPIDDRHSSTMKDST